MNRSATPLLFCGALAAVLVVGLGIRAQSQVPSTQPAPVVARVVSARPTPAVSARVAHRVAALRHVRSNPVAVAAPAVSSPHATAMDAGMRAFIDPETGALGGPSQEQLDALAHDAAVNESTEGLEQVTLPDGSVMMNLEGRFQDYYMVQLDAKGHRTVVCGRDQRMQFQHVPAPAALPEER